MIQQQWNNILTGHTAPSDTPEERFQEFYFPHEHPSTLLRRLLDDEPYVFAPGLYNAGGVKLAAYAGFKAAYLSGFSYAVEEHGVTDVGVFSRSELNQQAGRMVRASNYWVREQYVSEGKRADPLPLVMDMEDGHGGFGHVQMMMQQIVPMGVAAGHLEDQTEKRCGHLPGKVLVPTEKHIERLLAARSEADQQRREAASNTPSKSHNQLAGTKAYFVGGTVFGSQSFASRDVRKTDAELSLVGNEEVAVAD